MVLPLSGDTSLTSHLFSISLVRPFRRPFRSQPNIPSTCENVSPDPRHCSHHHMEVPLLFRIPAAMATKPARNTASGGTVSSPVWGRVLVFVAVVVPSADVEADAGRALLSLLESGVGAGSGCGSGVGSGCESGFGSGSGSGSSSQGMSPGYSGTSMAVARKSRLLGSSSAAPITKSLPR